MKARSGAGLLLVLVPRTFAFYPYTPSWMCSGDECLAVSQPDVVESTEARNVRRGFDIPTIRLRKMRTNSARAIELSINPSQKHSAAIEQDGLDYSYFAAVDFGSHKTSLWMLLDSGASTTWVPATGCKSKSCVSAEHKTYGPTNSSTYTKSTDTFKLSYGTGTVSGSYASDKVSFGGLTMELTFGAANVTSDNFNTFPFDGILGLGYANQSDSVKTFMGTVADKKLLKANLFGVDLSRASDGYQDGAINFGAPDTSKYKGSLAYSDVIKGSATWKISVDDAGYDGKSANLPGRTAIIDTGTTWVFMPPADAAQIFDLIDDCTLSGDKDTYYIPCDTTAPLYFTFSGSDFNISSDDWVGAVVDKKKNLCASNIYPVDAVGDGNWLVGDTFLKNVYTVFDFDNSRVGFGAKSAATSTSTTTFPGAASDTLFAQVSTTTNTSSTSTTSLASASASSTAKSSSGPSNIRFEQGSAVAFAFTLGIFLL